MTKRIIEESFALFKKHGIQYVTMDMVAQNLGISKKTIYKHFKNKKEILYISLKNYVDERSAHYEKIIRESPNVIAGLVMMVIQSSKNISEFNPVMFDELTRYYPDIAEMVKEGRKEEGYRQISSLIENGKEQGLFQKKISTDITTKLFMSQTQLLTNYTLFPIDEYSREELYEHVFYNFIRGISTTEGQAVIKELIE